jgi:AAA+ superfamily predicted ATPase
MAEIRIHRGVAVGRRGDSAAQQYMSGAFDAIMAAAFVAPRPPLHDGPSPRWIYLSTGGWSLLEPGARVLLSGDVWLELVEARFRDPSELESAVVSLSSDCLRCDELAAFVRALVEGHRNRGREDHQQFIFDLRASRDAMASRVNQHVNQTPEHVVRMQRVVSAPRHLSFAKHTFRSTKRFENLCGEDVRELERRITFFLENRNWYAAKGVPYQLGIMLSGECGTGKSSAIRAIANKTRRHVVNVNLANVTTTSQLKRLFIHDELHTFETDEQAEPAPVHVPVHQRIFVVEEIDALGAAVVDRRLAQSGTRESMPDELSLGELLGILDGGVEVPGRIIIMTSNYPERLDRALVRPGRIDVHVRFGLASRASLAELYRMLYDVDLGAAYVEQLPDRQLSPAEASEVLISFCSYAGPDKEHLIVSALQGVCSKK